jgi:hypothetical protein
MSQRRVSMFEETLKPLKEEGLITYRLRVLSAAWEGGRWVIADSRELPSAELPEWVGRGGKWAKKEVVLFLKEKGILNSHRKVLVKEYGVGDEFEVRWAQDGRPFLSVEKVSTTH